MADTLDTVAFRAALLRIRDAAAAAQAELDAADGRIGDGDTGIMLRRLFEAIAIAAPADVADLGLFFRACAKRASESTGSSLGTLVTVALMLLAKRLAGRTELPVAELGGLLGEIRDQAMARGGAALGDKTVVDMLDAVARAIDGLDREAAARAADQAVDETLADFRDRPNRIGRARMFAERSIGIDDPGMLAFARLTAVLTRAEGR
ncbi:DAK2 domain-containing protein [Azospirillum sp. B506]|uniref:DAK2 domain-containing protein n=1 Tax=Azospirillum sp. B506 TaxID=137721 RepID=UPI00034CA5A9|nr:DAK2 domain-containing protein [Azospirillum sp. B506]